MHKGVIISMLFLLHSMLSASSVFAAQDVCMELGFISGTKKFQDCVDDLGRRGLSGGVQENPKSEVARSCEEIGFKPSTDKFNDCLRRLSARGEPVKTPATISYPTNSDDAECRKYGFAPETSEHRVCMVRMESGRKVALEQQRLYEQQMRQYEAQLAAIEKERERQRSLKLMELGFRMMAGQPVTDAALATSGMAPLPKPAAPGHQTIVMPNGRVVTCTINGSVTNCF